jgi:hypothetical protein
VAKQGRDSNLSAPFRFQTRIVGHGNVAPEQLLANPNNFRVHSQAQQKAMRSTLAAVGWIDEIIVNTVTGHVINGHMRVNIAMRDGEPTVPVRYVELSEEEENLALATFDPISAMASHDKDVLESLLDDTKTNDEVLEQFLSKLLPAGRSQGEEVEDQEEELGESKFMILVDCDDEQDQIRLLGRFLEEGLQCRALST